MRRVAHLVAEDRWACTFEDGMAQGREGTCGGSARVSDKHPARGGRSLRAGLPPGPYPGIGADFKTPQDWSTCQALRFGVFNATRGPMTVCVRVDDADSKDFPTRYNNRGELKYAIGGDAFAGAARGGPVRIWLYVSDHGSWCWWHRAVACEGKPLMIRFEWSQLGPSRRGQAVEELAAADEHSPAAEGRRPSRTAREQA